MQNCPDSRYFKYSRIVKFGQHSFLLVRSCFLITLIKCLKGQKSQRLKVFSKCIYHCLCHCLCLCHCIFFGQVMSLHHSDQMSQRSQVSRVALCMSKVKVLSVSESVSQWVSQWQGHLLSRTAKKGLFGGKFAKGGKIDTVMFVNPKSQNSELKEVSQ